MASIWIGFDPREQEAYAVARESILRRLTLPIPVKGIDLSQLRKEGIYYRPTENRNGRLWDTISQAPMSTEFAISRFLTPHLAKSGWALFMDCDMLARENLARVFENIDPSKAVYCVKHDHRPDCLGKMDQQIQTTYPRKNWSSFMLFNCDHPANNRLTVEYVNSVPGRDLHAFKWLDDSEIGELDPSWNWLVGHSSKDIDPKVVHFTEGGPWMEGYENVCYAEEWRMERMWWAA